MTGIEFWPGLIVFLEKMGVSRVTDWQLQKDVVEAYRIDPTWAKNQVPWIRRGNQVFLDREALERLLEKKCKELFVGDGKRDG